MCNLNVELIFRIFTEGGRQIKILMGGGGKATQFVCIDTKGGGVTVDPIHNS